MSNYQLEQVRTAIEQGDPSYESSEVLRSKMIDLALSLGAIKPTYLMQQMTPQALSFYILILYLSNQEGAV